MLSTARRLLAGLARYRAQYRDMAATLALLLLPTVLVAGILALAPAAGDRLRASPAADRVVTGLAPLASQAGRMRALQRTMPLLALPASAPDIPPPRGDIRFAALVLPATPPTVPGEIRHSAMVLPATPPLVPGEIRLSALALPRDAPTVPGEIILPHLTLALAAPEIARPPAEVVPVPSIVLPVEPPQVAIANPLPPPAMCLAAAEPDRASQIDRADGRPLGERLAAAAIEQTRHFIVYNARYVRVAYPMGDVASMFGVCSDVVVRAYRALGIDLQELVHRAKSGPGDANIDHRRTEVLRRFFATHGERLPVTDFAEDYLPGDIVTYYRPQSRSSTSHIAVVTGVLSGSGRPMIVHNRGWGPQLEDALFVDQLTGHYRFAGIKADAVAALGPPPKPQATRVKPTASILAAVGVGAGADPAQASGQTNGQISSQTSGKSPTLPASRPVSAPVMARARMAARTQSIRPGTPRPAATQ